MTDYPQHELKPDRYFFQTTMVDEKPSLANYSSNRGAPETCRPQSQAT